MKKNISKMATEIFNSKKPIWKNTFMNVYKNGLRIYRKSPKLSVFAGYLMFTIYSDGSFEAGSMMHEFSTEQLVDITEFSKYLREHKNA